MVQPVRRQPPWAAEARRIASSSACDVGSPEASRSLAATARISPPLATTAPTGTSPFSAASSAATRARRIIARSVSENCFAAFSTTNPMIAARCLGLSRGRSRPLPHAAGALFALAVDLQYVAPLGANREETRTLEYGTGGGNVRLGKGQGRAEMRPDPTPFQDKRPVCAPPSERLARCRDPQPQCLPYYLRTSRGHDATRAACSGG